MGPPRSLLGHHGLGGHSMGATMGLRVTSWGFLGSPCPQSRTGSVSRPSWTTPTANTSSRSPASTPSSCRRPRGTLGPRGRS
uniref:Uncharacterized protein n=1 Tax=Strix occidentalis caurina TaxID=311401 RepID=A0A8D0KXA5_STROC